VLGHEWTLVVLAGLILSAGLNWHGLVDPRHTLPQDSDDPALVTYLIAWAGHALLHDPSHLWQLNAFYRPPTGWPTATRCSGTPRWRWSGPGPRPPSSGTT